MRRLCIVSIVVLTTVLLSGMSVSSALGQQTPIWEKAAYANIQDCPAESALTELTPIVLAWGNSEFENSFTGVEDGVRFEVSPNVGETLGWPKKNANIGFLVLPDASGHVYSIKYEMFGNLTHQTAVPAAVRPDLREDHGDHVVYLSNGFEALAEYDLRENGGNGNGLIDPGDRVWPLLRVWQNKTHDGWYDEIKKPDEIFTLNQLNIPYISFRNYVKTAVKDGHNNKQLFLGTPITTTTGDIIQVYDVVLSAR